ncbi:MAG: hypothetical protein ACX94B_15165 [Henriciella sp.]
MPDPCVSPKDPRRTRNPKLKTGRKDEAQEDFADLGNAKAVLGAVRAALAGGDRGRADRLITAWKVQARRARDLAALEAEAAEALAADETAPLSDAALAAEVSALLGRTVRLRE